jgi:5-formyltetrahydrofolate cyclo-ligase
MVRATLRAAVASLSPATRMAASEAIVQQLLGHPHFAAARVVALFSPLPSEPDPVPLMKFSPGKTYCFPRVDGGRLAFHRVADAGALHPGFRDILEPAEHPGTRVAPEELDLIVVPGLGFTPRGDRLGRGAGFYDRLLAEGAPATKTIGVCFSIQLTRQIPTEPHDRPVDAVIAS